MSIMSGNLYKALKAANLPDELAEKASEEVASFDKKFIVINTKLNILIIFMIAVFVLLLGLLFKNLM